MPNENVNLLIGCCFAAVAIVGIGLLLCVVGISAVDFVGDIIGGAGAPQPALSTPQPSKMPTFHRATVTARENMSYYVVSFVLYNNSATDWQSVSFYSDGGERYPCWVEDSNATYARIFVNVTDISTTGTHVNVRYGDPARNGPESVFPFFEDFSD